MNVSRLMAVLLMAVLAGCSASGSDTKGKPVELPEGADIDTGLGVVTGVVVDVAIRPLEAAEVKLSGAGLNLTAATDAGGVFRFEEVPPGTYVLAATHRLYKPAQLAVQVEEGAETPVARLVLEPTFTQQPYAVPAKFDGLLNCGYEAVLISAPCVTDYTSILPVCPGGCAPDLRKAQGDTREYATGVEDGWESLLIEMTWEPSAAGTSEEMGFLVSFEQRTAQHWFGLAQGVRPLRLELFPGVEDATAQVPDGMDASIAPEGRNDLIVLGSVRAGETTDHTVGAAVQQKFTIYQHTFYHATPPEGWSFLAGDEVPF